MKILLKDGTFKFQGAGASYAWPAYMSAPVSDAVLDLVIANKGDAETIVFDGDKGELSVDGVPLTPDSQHALAQAIYTYGSGVYTDQWHLTNDQQAPGPPEDLTPEQIKTRKKNVAKGKAAKAIRQVGALYTLEEQATWWMQWFEAVNWNLNQSFPTPFLDGLISKNPRDKAELVGIILTKGAEWAFAAGEAVGERQKEVDLADAE
jgi:hypothetical protein